MRRFRNIGYAFAFMLLTIGISGTSPACATVTLSEAALRSGQSIDTLLERVDDPDGRLDIADIRSRPMLERFALDGRQPARCRWYRFRLSSSLQRSGPWVLSTESDSATLYEPSGLGYRSESFGQLTPVASRRLRNGLADIDLKPDDYERELYVRLEGAPVPALSFQTVEAATQEVRNRDLVGVFYFSIYGVLAAAALLFAAATRAKAFVYYGLYIAAQALDVLGGVPFATINLWPRHAVDPLLLNTAYGFFANVAYYQFLRHALETRASRKLDRLMIGFGAMSTIAICYCFVSDEVLGTSLDKHLLPFVLIAAYLVPGAVAYIRWRQRFVSAGFYLVGLMGFLIGFVFEPFASFDTADIGFTFEAFAFLAALAFRLVALTNERQLALVETLSAREATASEYAKRIATTELFNEAFSRFVPQEFLKQLGRTDVREVVLGDHVEREMTVMFCDIRSFVSMSEDMTPETMFQFLNVYFGRIGPIVRKHGGFIDKYLGDGVMALFSGPTDEALQAAVELHAEVRRLNEVRAREGERPVQIGVGLHCGPTILATIGERERYDTTVVADVVNLASRLEGMTGVYGAQIIASDAVVSGAVDRNSFNCRWLGEVVVQGASAPLSTFEICDGDPAELLLHKRNTGAIFSDAVTAYRRSEYSTSRMLFDDLVRREPADRVAAYFSERSRQRAALVDAGWDGIERQPTKR